MTQVVAADGAQPRILMLAPIQLSEPRAGDGIRIHAMASHFARRCDLTLVTVDAASQPTIPTWRTVVLPMKKNNALLTVVRSVTMRMPYETARFTFRRIAAPPEGPFDAVYLHLPQAWEMWRKLGMPRAPVTIVDFHNDDYDIWRQRADAEPNTILRAAFTYWMRLSESSMHELVDSSDLIFCVSDADKASLERREGNRISAKLFVVPNGVDVEYFRRPKGVNPARREAIFVASLDARRNQAATKRLLEMWPAIARRVQEARLSIVGRNPPAWLLARRSDAIKVVDSPTDIRPYLWNATAFLAPFEIGGGTKIKILEAMAAGTPIIASRGAMQGLPVVADRHYLDVASVRDAEDKVVRAFENQAILSAISRESSRVVREFDWSLISARAFELIASRLTAGELT